MPAAHPAVRVLLWWLRQLVDVHPSARFQAVLSMFGLNAGETFVVVFILTAIVSAPLWPAAGEWVAVKIWERTRASKRDHH
jgi:hypothetical protein